jgi:hypothetical protein
MTRPHLSSVNFNTFVYLPGLVERAENDCVLAILHMRHLLLVVRHLYTELARWGGFRPGGTHCWTAMFGKRVRGRAGASELWCGRENGSMGAI